MIKRLWKLSGDISTIISRTFCVPIVSNQRTLLCHSDHFYDKMKLICQLLNFGKAKRGSFHCNMCVIIAAATWAPKPRRKKQGAAPLPAVQHQGASAVACTPVAHAPPARYPRARPPLHRVPLPWTHSGNGQLCQPTYCFGLCSQK